MPHDRTTEYLIALAEELRGLPNETEWVEFKHNNANPEEIGKYISALSNSAALLSKPQAYLLWGIDDDTHEVLGTTFTPATAKKGNQDLEIFLTQLLQPRINFRFHSFEVEEKPVVLLEIDPATHSPVRFSGTGYIRVGTSKRSLKDSGREADLWRSFDRTPFEAEIALPSVTSDEVLSLLDYTSYFDLTKRSLPDNRAGILDALQSEKLINPATGKFWDITCLGAILFAKSLEVFPRLSAKAVRVVLYDGNNKLKAVREVKGKKGYANGFQGLIDYVESLLPSNEVIGKAIREEVTMYPMLSVRELVANALIHQDFQIDGSAVMIEIYDGRIEITNPGAPLMQTDRLLDMPPQSRNEALASMMMRIGVCEKRGTGIDKVVVQTEFYQLPAPVFEAPGDNMRAILFAHKDFGEMTKKEKVRACYLHACLRYVERQPMNNTTLRERFKVDSKNSASISGILKSAMEAGAILLEDESVGHKAKRYLPFWARPQEAGQG